MKHPKKSGFWILTLDDGEIHTIEPTLVRVNAFDDGTAAVEFLNTESEVSQFVFDLKTMDQEIVSLYAVFYGGCGRANSKRGEFRVTWLSEVKPPRGAPRKNDEAGRA